MLLGCFTVASDSSWRRRFCGAIAFSNLSLNKIPSVARESNRQLEEDRMACGWTPRHSQLHSEEAISSSRRDLYQSRSTQIFGTRPAAMALFACCRVSAIYTCYMAGGMPLVMRVHRLRCISVLCHSPEDVRSAPALQEQNRDKTAIRAPRKGTMGRGPNRKKTAIGRTVIGPQ